MAAATWLRMSSFAISCCEVSRNVSRSSASRLTKFARRLTMTSTTPSTTRARAAMIRPRLGPAGARGGRCGGWLAGRGHVSASPSVADCGSSWNCCGSSWYSPCSAATWPLSRERQPRSTSCTCAAPTIGSSGSGSSTGWRMNGRVWRPPMPAVERDQLLERAALVELGVVEAADHDVRDVREAVRAEQVPRRRSARSARAGPSPSTVPSARERAPLPPSDDGAALGGAHEEPADVRVLASAGSAVDGAARSPPGSSAAARP